MDRAKDGICILMLLKKCLKIYVIKKNYSNIINFFYFYIASVNVITYYSA